MRFEGPFDYRCFVGMTADVFPFDAAFLSRAATRIVN